MLSEEIVNELFRSEDMRRHVLENLGSFSKDEIAWIVYYAPISIFRKKELLDMMGSPIDFERFTWYWSIDLLVDLMNLRKNEYVIVYKENARTESVVERNNFYAYEDIKNYFKTQRQDEYIYTIQLYCYNARGDFGPFPRPFYVVNGEICCAACYQGGGIYYEGDAYSIYSPFKAGDIIEIDCRPFVQTRHFLLLRSGDKERGLPIALYMTEYGKVKMEQRFDSNTMFQYCPIPPLYDAKLCEELSVEEETVFSKIIEWLRMDESNAEKIEDYMYKNAKGEGVSPSNIIKFIDDVASNETEKL